MNREEVIDKILTRMTRMDYTSEHKKISENYSQPYNDALVWVLDVCLDFQMPTGTIDDPTYSELKVKDE